MKNRIRNQGGFTLIELMVAMAIASAVLATMGVYYQSQQRSSVTNQVVVDLQQNVRAAMYFLTRDIRLAGYNPNPADGAVAGILVAESDTIRFNMDTEGGGGDGKDNDGDGDIDEADEDGDGVLTAGEAVEYRLYNSGACPGAGGGTVQAIGRDVSNDKKDPQPLACYIDALDFVYLDADGNDLDTNNDGDIDANDLDDIRTVQITIVARTQEAGYLIKHKDDTVYSNQQGDIIYTPSNDDTNRRVILTTEVKMRNLGL